MRFLPLTAVTTAMVLTLAAVAAAAPVAGTQLNGTITESFNSKTAYVGQPVVLTNVTSASGSGSITGAKMYGTVTKVVRAGQGRKAELQISFQKLVLANGARYYVNGVVTGMKTNTKSNALKEAAGAVGGMIIGNMIGKTIFHMGGGGFLGAAGGFLIAKNNRADMVIPQGSVVGVQLGVVRRQAGH